MWPYWLLFLLPATLALMTRGRKPSPMSGLHSTRLDAVWLAFILLYTFIIGYRLEVGGDWQSYLNWFQRSNAMSLVGVLGERDPGYMLVNWFSGQLGWGIWGVNFFCGLTFMLGLALFSRSLPRPWVAVTVAIPYLFTVVAMGYSRQGVALGFVMVALVFLRRARYGWFIFWILVGATFHQSAVLALPIAVLAATRNRLATVFWIAVVSAIAYLVLLEDSVEDLYQNYVIAEYSSQGALIRAAMNLAPALLFLSIQRRFKATRQEIALWRLLSIVSLVLFGLAFTFTATTAVDRVALYILPLQLFVFTHLPSAWSKDRDQQSLLVVLVVAYYGLVHFVWLNYADNSQYWLPYRNWLFE